MSGMYKYRDECVCVYGRWVKSAVGMVVIKTIQNRQRTNERMNERANVVDDNITAAIATAAA